MHEFADLAPFARKRLDQALGRVVHAPRIAGPTDAVLGAEAVSNNVCRKTRATRKNAATSADELSPLRRG